MNRSRTLTVLSAVLVVTGLSAVIALGVQEKTEQVEQVADVITLDAGHVDNYLATLAALSLTDYTTYSADTEDLAATGLDDPELTITVTYMPEDEDASETFVLYLSPDPEQDESDTDVTTAFARVGDSSILYQITGEEYDALMSATTDDMRHTDLLPVDFTEIGAIEATVDGQSYQFTVDDPDEVTFDYDGESVDFTSFRSAFQSLAITEFTDETPGDVLELGLQIQLRDEDETVVEIDFYRYDGSDCLAVVDGQPTGLVSRSDVVDLAEAVNSVVLND